MTNGYTFILNFDAKLNVSQMKGAIGNIQSELNRLQLPQNLTKGITGTLASLEKEVRNFEVAAGRDLSQKKNFSALERSAEKIQSLFKDISIQSRDLGKGVDLSKFIPDDASAKIKKAQEAIDNYTDAIKRMSSQEKRAETSIRGKEAKQTVFKEELENLKEKIEEYNKTRNTILADIFKSVGMGGKDTSNIDNIETAFKAFEKLQQVMEAVASGKATKADGSLFSSEEIQKAQLAVDKIKQLKQQYDGVNESIKNVTAAQKSSQNSYDKITNEIDKAKKALDELKKINASEAQSAIQKVFAELNKQGFDTSKFQQNIDGAKQALEAFKASATGNIAQALNNITQVIGNMSPSVEKLRSDMDGARDSFKQFETQTRDISAVKSRIQYFFGLNNAINLARRAIRGAIATVKELDKAMTETAVVTSNTVSDMWAKLPEYTKRANELGVSTLEAYQAATLYYQQGLNDDQTAALSVETLKMARIAGLEAADATDRMTNALRGFNMELNEVSAQKVDDVYSQLAAMSASNVDEISTAMTKVASLAHNANMEFETTAAFLAQIIETTRESAETAGTALKTVVARFSEVKKLYDMDELKGKDEEGQNIDVNKVSSALRTAGIDLNKYFLGEVGLDDIFMELASKWDSLTSVQQRYIATQAAGSRQQSRFIALMQDYARTQQLVSAAYDANGASAKQFEKTQESLQSKLARLKNAWNEFLMGLANNSIVKGVVDLLTGLLNIVNKLTSVFGTGAGFVLKWVTAFTAFGALKNIFRGGGILDLALMGGLTAGGKTGLANAAVRAGILSGLVRQNGQTTVAPGLVGDAGLVAAENAKKTGRSGSIILGGVGGLLKKGWSSAQVLGTFAKGGFGIGGPGLSNSWQSAKLGATLTQGTSAGMAAGLVGVATALGAVAAAAAAAYGAYQLWLNLSPKGQLKNAQKYADAMSEAATNAQKQASELQKASKQVKDYDKAVSQASTSAERRQAIEDRNNYIESLLEQDSRYAEYLTTTFEDGQMVLKLNIDSKDIENAIKGADMAQAGSDFASAIVADKQIAILKNKLDNVDLTNKRINYNEAGNIAQRAMTKDEIAEYTKYQRDLDRYTSQFSSYAQKAFSELISNDKITNDVANLMSKALAEGFDDTKLPTGSGWWSTRGHWQNEYIKAYGTEADSNMKTADIYRAVKMYEITSGQADSTQKLADLLTGEFKEAYQSLLEGFTGEGKLTSKNLLGLDTGNEGSIYDFLGLDVSNIDELGTQLYQLADALGMTTDEVREGIKKRAQAEKKAQAQVAFNTSANMYQAGVNGINIAKYLTLENIEDQQLFNDLFSNFDASYLSDELVGNILDSIRSGDKELSNWLKSIDLSNPIQSANKLTSAVQNKNIQGAIQDTAKALLEAGNASGQFSASAQLGYFTTSQSFENLSEQLDKFVEENGKISAANVKELAEANADLNALLKNNITSATGLAHILTEIQAGTINTWDLTDAIIAATAAMDDLDGIVAQTISDLNSFDPGYDENDVTKFINKVLDNATENIGKGATGNNQMRNYMEYIFGNFEYEGPKEGYGAAYEAWLNNNVAWLEANKDNMFSAWSDFAAGLDDHMLEAAEIYEKDGEIIINANGMTTDQLIAAMVESSNLTEQQARMMITDFKNYSSDFAHEMAMNDLPNAVQAWMDALPEINGKKIYDENELNTLAQLLHVKTDVIDAEVKKLKASSEKYSDIKFQNVKFTDDEGLRTQESITEAWNQIDPTILHKGLTQEDGSISDVFNFDAIKQAYSDLGMPQMFEQDFNQIAQAGDKFFANFFGKPTEISIEEGQTAGEAYANAYQQAVNQDLADKLAKSIGSGLKKLFGGEDGFDVVINTEEGVANLNLVKTAAENVTTAAQTADRQTVAPTGDTSGLAGVSSALDAIIAKIAKINSSSVSPGGGYQPADDVMAAGGIVDSYATGSEKNHVSPGIALTGEEGPEIVWNKDKGYAYITGENHPEFQNLQPGDRVFNAQETKKILSGAAAGGKVPSLAHGYIPGASSSSGGGSGGSDDKTPDEWKNDLDWLYNLMEDIAELERDQKAIEERYEDYLSDQSKTGGDLYKLLVQQLGNLYTQLNHQTFALEKREQEMREFMDVTNDQDQYLWYNWEDRTLEIDWDAIDQITDEEQYKHVKELIDEAESIQDKMDDADDAVMDITNQIQELENVWRDTYVDFEGRVLDALVKSYQQVIDKYSELNTTLNDSNAQILDSLQKQISLERQIRDNTKTEEQISDSEARLAYLRRDTSGGNELAALQLERELADQRESYEDTLVDQAISRLQEDNDAAAQQRERQIEIMQAQLDYQSENGEFNAYIKELLTSAMGADGELLTNSDLMNLLKEQENWDAMSDVNKEVWEEELNTTFKEVAAFLLKQNAEENGTFYTALTAAVESVSAAIGSYSQAMVKLGSEISSAGSSGGGSSGGGSGPSGGGKPPQSTTIPKPRIGGGCFAPGTKILMSDYSLSNIETIKIGDVVIAYNEQTQQFVPRKVTKSYIHHNTPAMVKLIFTDNSILELTPGHPLYSTNGWKSLDIENSLYEHNTIATLLHIGDEIIGINGNKIVKTIEWLVININYNSYNIEVEDCHTFLANGLVAHNAKAMHMFATGGLADSTGLAWLDGTPSEPEYVLNARQTEAFLKLSDVLPSMMDNIASMTQNTFGDTYVNLSVNLESVSPDYDVDRMVDLVKDKLYDVGSYRNVNSLSFLR